MSGGYTLSRVSNEKTDKTVVFQKVFQKSVTANTVKERVFKMAKSFSKRGRTGKNIRRYQKLNKQVGELAKGSASKWE